MTVSEDAKRAHSNINHLNTLLPVLKQMLTTSLVCLLIAFQTLPYVPSPSCFTTLYLSAEHLQACRSSLDTNTNPLQAECKPTRCCSGCKQGFFKNGSEAHGVPTCSWLGPLADTQLHEQHFSWPSGH